MKKTYKIALVILVIVIIVLSFLAWFLYSKSLVKKEIENLNPDSISNVTSSSVLNQQSKDVTSKNSKPQPVEFSLPSECKFAGFEGDINSSLGDSNDKGVVLNPGQWLVDCGVKNDDVRGTLGPVLLKQGWKFCDSETATAHYWKNGLITTLAQGASNSLNKSLPSFLSQMTGVDCQ